MIDVVEDLLGPARDQGNRGTCLAFATTASHIAARHVRRGPPAMDLSVEALYSGAKRADGNSEPGTSPLSIAASLREDGQPAEVQWPYDLALRDTEPLPVSPALQGPFFRATLNPCSSDLAGLEALLASGNAIVLGLDLWPGFYNISRGTVCVTAATDLLGDGHAVTLVGADSARRLMRIRNSWGPGWGDAGHAWLPADAWAVAGLGVWVVVDDIDT